VRVPVPADNPRKLVPVAFEKYFPGVILDNVRVGDYVPDDEKSAARLATSKALDWLARHFGPNQPALWEIADDPVIALRHAYPRLLESCFPTPKRPESLEPPLADLGDLAVRGPFALLIERGDDDLWYWQLEHLAEHDHHDGIVPLGCKVCFQVSAAENRLKPIWIESALGHISESDAVWHSAVHLAMCAANTELALVRHYNWVHLAFGCHVAIASRNWLPAEHPVRRLLWPHVHGTQYSNELSARAQLPQHGDFAQVFSLTATGVWSLFSETYQSFDAVVHDPHLDAVRRGVDKASFPTPTDDSLCRFYDIFLNHTNRYLAHYYPTCGSACEDAHVRRWRQALEDLVPNGVKSICPLDPNQTELARLCASIIYFATVQHDLVGTFLWNYQLWSDTAPVRIYENGERVPVDVYQRLVHGNFVLNVSRTPLMQDFSYLALDPNGADTFKMFLRELEELDQALTAEGPSLWQLRPRHLEAHINA
jgi:arachidonate 15-lipoxygenase